MTRCFHCGAHLDNGVALCDLCRRKAVMALEFLPIHFRNLARWRPGRAGSRPVPGSRVLYDGTVRGTGTGDRISDTLDETVNMLTTWARALVDARPQLGRLLDRLAAARAAERLTEAETVAWLCKGFERYMSSIVTIDWCAEFVRDVSEHETKLSAFTERYVPGWYAGGCRQVVAFDGEGAAVRCDSGTYVVPGLTWVTCSACGTTTYARDHLEVILEEARDWVAPPKRIAEAVVALVDTELSVPRLYARIRKWAQDERIRPIHRVRRGYGWSADDERFVVVDEETGKARYRFGDVLDRVFDTTAQPNQHRRAS